mgnify:FL=1|jgi:hypothetical protein|tara:strand:+ start:151 stop:1116 length:966 start_codon:yes stop_codon:yes gene_type:complete
MITKIPKQGVSIWTKTQIEKSLPQPKVYAGWKFNNYKWIRLDQVNIKKDGFTDNSVRLGGTRGRDDVLEASLDKGLDTTKLTMSICPVNNLLNGFNRYSKLIKLGYKEWIFAEYEKDENTKTEFQDGVGDYIDDFRLAANDGDGAVAVTPEEITEIARKRFTNRKDKSKLAVCRYVHSLNLNLTKQQVEGIGQTVSKHYQRQGVVESIDRKNAEDKAYKINPDAAVLNTKDKTRTLRIFPQIMEHFIKTGKPLKYIDFHSSAVSHKEVDDGRTNSEKNLAEMDRTILDYASQRTKTGIIPWEKLGSLSQKIGVENSNELIK